MDRPLVIGKGSCWEIKPGVWQYRHSLGRDPETGKYRYSSKRTIHTKKKSEVYAAMEAYKVELNTGVAVKKTGDTVGEYAERFHEERRGTMKSPLAYEREATDVRHIKELFGNVRIQDLRPQIIRQTYAKARKNGAYSENELNKIHMKLKQIMRQAVDDDLLAKNPCDKVSVPRPEAKEREALSAKEASRLLTCLLTDKPDAHIAATLLMLDTGIRRGESLGLTWGHFDEDAATISVVQQYAADKQIRSPKSKTSNRRLSLSTYAVSFLRQWRDRQEEELAKYGLRPVGGTPIAHSLSPGKDDDGRKVIEVIHMDPNNYGRWFRNWCVKHGFGSFENVEEWRDKKGVLRRKGTGYKGLTPHMLRHTQATLLIGNNTDIKTVQSRLGHSSVNLTLDIYSHAIAANDRAASDTFSRIIAPGRAEDRPATPSQEAQRAGHHPLYAT